MISAKERLESVHARFFGKKQSSNCCLDQQHHEQPGSSKARLVTQVAKSSWTLVVATAAFAAAGITVGSLLHGNSSSNIHHNDNNSNNSNHGDNLLSLTERTRPTTAAYFSVPTKNDNTDNNHNKEKLHGNSIGLSYGIGEREHVKRGRSLSVVASAFEPPENLVAGLSEEQEKGQEGGAVSKAADASYFPSLRPLGSGWLGDDNDNKDNGEEAEEEGAAEGRVAPRRLVALKHLRAAPYRAGGGFGFGAVAVGGDVVVDAEFGDDDSPPPEDEDEYEEEERFVYGDGNPDAGVFSRRLEAGEAGYYRYDGATMVTGGGGGGGRRERREGRREREIIIPPSLPFERRFLESASGDDAPKISIGEKEGDVCSPLEVVGIDDCPELEGDALERMLGAKRDMLRQVVEVLTDPASSGDGRRPDEPLLLVQKLAVDETDAIYGAFEKKFVQHTTDAGAWNPQPGGFNRWVERYYREVLRETRPVLVTVHGDDVCALEHELSLEKRLEAAGLRDLSDENAPQSGRRMPGHGENFEIPVVLMTVGWDPSGDPTHREDDLGRDRTCVFRVLELPRVVKWFTSHTRYDSHTDEKFRYLPIGFGGYETRNGLPHSAYIAAAKKQLEILETCPTDKAGSYDLLFQCNTLDRDPRTKIWKSMTEKESGPFPINRAPLKADQMVVATSRGIFAVSPPGTGPDCFRHYEMMLEGNIAMVPDVYSLRRFMEGLPAFFFGHGEDWGSLTCGRLAEMAEIVQAKIREGKEGKGGLEFEKMTHGFWRRYIRREMLLAAGNTDEDAPYVERSVAPLNVPGWTTFRRLGCFSRKKQFGHHIARVDKKRLEKDERTPAGCAKHCSIKRGGGVGFFGISDGNMCWCDKSPGEPVRREHCNVSCKGDERGGHCGGKHYSTAYAFGPEGRGMEFEYLGCFPDTSRIMYHVDVRLRKNNNPFMCEALCTSLRYPFFALGRGEWCRCGVLPSNTPRSVRVPAYIEGAGYKPIPGPPNATFAGKPMPDGVTVGDPRFECSRGRCSGDSSLWGCGSKNAYDLYKVLDPCVLYRDCRKE